LKETHLPIARVNGIAVNYVIDNESAADGTIVLINGLADDVAYWGLQMPPLVGAGYRVLRFDNRGIGKSDKPAGPYTSRLLADDAKALVDRLGIRDFHLMGTSMGGMIAQEYALAYPNDLKSLTLACTYGTADPFCQTMFAMWADLAKGMGVPFVMRDVALWAFTSPFFEDRPGDAAESAAAMAQLDMSLEAYLAQLAVIQTHDALGRVGQIKVPTLVIAGEEDILIPVRLSQRLHAAIPGSAWATVPGGHACLRERPNSFNAAFVEFVRAVSS
jgi:3-oxoadipate enol-lactonase